MVEDVAAEPLWSVRVDVVFEENLARLPPTHFHDDIRVETRLDGGCCTGAPEGFRRETSSL